MPGQTAEPVEMNLSLAEMERKRLERDVEKAERIQKRMLADRKKAPKGIVVGGIVGDPWLEKMKRYVPEGLAKPRRRDRKPGVFRPGATMEVVGAEAGENNSKYKELISDGFVPVLDEDGDQVRQGPQLMFKRPIEFLRDRLQRDSAIAAAQLAATGEALKEQGPADGVTEDVTHVEENAELPT